MVASLSQIENNREFDRGLGSTLVSRNITVGGKRTSVRLEPEMWRALKEIAAREHCSIHELCTLISFRKNARTSLTAAIRVFLMLYFRAATTEDGHGRAGHGSFDNMKRRAGWHERAKQQEPKTPNETQSPTKPGFIFTQNRQHAA
jgi:predicted DNA-binding ribbon-helix-helix protein